jgi:hypothetical protein
MGYATNRCVFAFAYSTRRSTEQDVTLDAASFARLNPDVQRIFVTENEINFLAFPPVKNSMVVFGAGYGFEMLANASWLSHRRIHYWGDIDTHGFAILDQLRSQFEHVESFLMNRETLLAFASQWDWEEKQTVRDLPGLGGWRRPWVGCGNVGAAGPAGRLRYRLRRFAQ